MIEPAYLHAIRESYNTVSEDYLKLVQDLSGLDGLSRAMLAAFAERVRSGGLGPVADLGCGPGVVTAHVAAMDVPIFGIDLSPRMIELAQRRFPHLHFAEGSMTALEAGDAELGGILAFYSIHHTPPQHLPALFAKFHRALAPGGHLLVGTHLGDGEHLRPTQAYGHHPVSYETYLQPADRIVELLEAAGFTMIARLVQEPGENSKRRQGCFLATRSR
ncbi:class I SAM-dependent DNA methyltransferase [Rhizocola hellebori]|uniref:class I SAM-dependent DNA methyltransferase n=1 Tax=Rhizocola hellebori TaxID=1392758 RepID=UPI0019410627|nr:class I SAM-dependent methyltransferase [Rhizocola hellebori]